MTDRSELIADLLMGAALADSHLDGRELDSVKKLLCEAMGRLILPPELEERLDSFDMEQLDVSATVAELSLGTAAQKRYLLELIAAVHDADEVRDLDEDAYLRQVAAALQVPEGEYADLALDVISIVEIGMSLMPPPLPGPAPKPPPLPK